MAGGDATRLTGGAVDVVEVDVVEVDVVEVDVLEVDVVDEVVPGRPAFFVEVVLSAAGPGAGCVVLDMNPGRVPVPATPLVVVVAGSVVEVDVELLVVVGNVPGTVPGGGYEGTLELVVVDVGCGVVVVVVEVGAEVVVVGRVVVVAGPVVVVAGLVVVVVLVVGTLDEVVLPLWTVVVVVVGKPVVVVAAPGSPIAFGPSVDVLPWAAKRATPTAPAGAVPVTKSTAATENSKTPVAVQARPSLNWDFASLLPAAFRGEDIRAPTSVRGVGNIPARRPNEIIAPRAGLLPPSPPGLTSSQGPGRKRRRLS